MFGAEIKMIFEGRWLLIIGQFTIEMYVLHYKTLAFRWVDV